MDQNNKNNEGIDLSGAFKDSGTSAGFQEQGADLSYYPETSKLAQLVIKYSGGLVKDEKQANYVLLGFAVAVFVISLFLIFGGGETKIEAPFGQKVIYPENEPPRLQ